MSTESEDLSNDSEFAALSDDDAINVIGQIIDAAHDEKSSAIASK